MQTTVGIIKPEAIGRNLVPVILERIVASDLFILSLNSRSINSAGFDVIYGSVQEPNWLHEARRAYLTSNETVFLKIHGDDAVRKLLDLRGYSNPKYAKPGTLRGDFAHDQDYVELRKQKKMALNIFHACDTEEEAQRLVSYFDL
jgi:nucleoside-diphosphate kinase